MDTPPATPSKFTDMLDAETPDTLNESKRRKVDHRLKIVLTCDEYMKTTFQCKYNADGLTAWAAKPDNKALLAKVRYPAKAPAQSCFSRYIGV